MTSPFPEPGREVARTGNPRCGSKADSNAPACGAPATWHVAWSLTPGGARFSLVCDEHLVQAQTNYVYAARHRATVTCDMPGTGWVTGRSSRCVPVAVGDSLGGAQ